MTTANRTLDRLCAELAERQLGLLGHSQLVELGIPDHFIDYRLRTGRWVRVQPMVYMIAGAHRSPEQGVLAACLSAGPEAVASHRTAAWLWGLDGPFAGWVEVNMPRMRRHRPHQAVIHRSTDLTVGHVTLRRGIPVTKPARTLADLGAVVSQSILDRALDDALAKKLLGIEGLLIILDEVGRKGRRGIGPLRKSLAGRTAVPATVLEAAFSRLVRRYGLPEPVYQYELRDPSGRFVGLIDAAYPDLQIAIELDSSDTHSSPAALQYDLARQNAIVACGFLPLRYTWADTVGRPERTANDVDKMISRQRAELGRVTRA